MSTPATMQQRRDTAANWAATNPTLAQGEIGIDITALATDTPAIKVGDGATAWVSLPYLGGSSGSSYLGPVASQAAMLALSAAVVGEYCYRTDVPSFYYLIASPPATLANWAVPETVTAAAIGATTTPAANTVPEWDGNKNLSANGFNPGFASTVTSGTPVVLTVASPEIQYWTGSTAQNVTLPTTSVPAGFGFLFINKSSATITVNASGGATTLIMAASTKAIFYANTATPTLSTDWNALYHGVTISSGKGSTFTNSLTMAGTDGTTMTFPTTSATIARTDAAQTFTGVQTMTSPNFTTPVLGTPSSGVITNLTGSPTLTLTNCTSLPIAGVTNLSSTRVAYTTTQTGLTVPAGITGVWIESFIGPGGGGGSGRRGAAGTVRCGGGGGGASALIENYWIPAALLSTTFTLTLPAGAAGGAAVTADNTNGNPGTAAALASFVSGSFALYIIGGAASGGGTAASGSGGGASIAQYPGTIGASASTTGLVGPAGGTGLYGASGSGAAGGGVSAADAAANGGNGGGQFLNTGFTVPAGGIVGGAAPGAGNAAQAGIGGLGGGGGAASITTAAQAGATPTGYGGGGGGGGASLNGNNSGAGGSGGPAYCRLNWVYT
jgi:hypothetical protein